MTTDEVFEKYLERFGVPLFHPPLNFGHIAMSVDELARYGRDALEAGEPIDWTQHFDPLPDGALS